MSVKVVFFVAYGGGHINMILPVIKAIKKKAAYKVVVLGLTTARFSLEANNIHYLGFKDILTAEDSDAIHWGKKLVNDLGSSALVGEEESIAYLGLSYKDLICRYGKERAAKLYEEKGKSAFLPLSTMEKIFFLVKPDLVISTNSPRAEKAAILTAGKHNIPSICLMDLFDQREIDDRLGKVGYASKICVFSDTVRQLLIKSGRPVVEIVVTGNPDFDKLSDPELKIKAALFLKRNNISSKKVVLWVRHAGELNFDLNKMIDDEVVKIAKKNKDIFFIIRPHPNEPKKYTELPENILVSTSADDLHEVLLSSALVLTIASTVGLQAVSCGIPLITFDMGPTSRYTPYSKMGLSVGVNDLSKLEGEIHSIFCNGFDPRKGVPVVGKATENVLSVIFKLIR